MEDQSWGILVFDVAASTSVGDAEKLDLRETFERVQRDHRPLPGSSRVVGDAGALVYGSCADAYEAARSLVRAWQKNRETLASAVLLGLRCCLHAAPPSEVIIPPPPHIRNEIGRAFRAMAGHRPDVVLLSIEAYGRLKDRLARDRISVVEIPATVSGDAAAISHAITFSELFGPDQYLVRLAPPGDLLLFLASTPSEVFRVPPRRFEEVIAELLADFGYQVELTKETRDNGIDIVAIRRELTTGLDERYLVQCKRHQPAHKVGVSVVHELLGVGAEEPHTGLIIATTSTFTQPARILAAKETVKWRLHLRDYADIQHWLEAYAARRAKKA